MFYFYKFLSTICQCIYKYVVPTYVPFDNSCNIINYACSFSSVFISFSNYKLNEIRIRFLRLQINHYSRQLRLN